MTIEEEKHSFFYHFTTFKTIFFLHFVFTDYVHGMIVVAQFLIFK